MPLASYRTGPMNFGYEESLDSRCPACLDEGITVRGQPCSCPAGWAVAEYLEEEAAAYYREQAAIDGADPHYAAAWDLHVDEALAVASGVPDVMPAEWSQK